ncbi:S-layer family protein [Bradyrhizobium sp. WSM1743]|uniref:beta strand repeat-containing protein n=1 Tax=Bradyrhizobium sp. WSM1743 TaxID=318996 RepID=UPI000416943C|nr:choice-of-anchor tandem repeat GloVer-containing protein [Bradyrhizobium sp. WSM1743]
MTATRDADGDGSTDQIQTAVTAIDGSQIDTITNLGRLGAVEDQSITTTSADGLTRTTQWDFVGSGTVDRTRSDVIVKNLDGSVTETVTDTDASGALYQKAILTTSADGRTKTVKKQTPGQSYFDYSEVTTTAVDGSSKTVAEYVTTAGVVLDQAITTVSADGLSETVQQDSSGSGTYDYTATTNKNIDGSTVTNATYLNASGQTIERVVTTVSPDGLVTTIDKDSTNAGWFDSINTIVARPDGSTVSTTRYLNSSGATTSELVTVTSADGNIVTQSVPPTISGTVAGQTTTSEHPVHPFSGTTISDQNPGATDVLTITLSGAGGTLSGAGLIGSGNTYTLSGSASTITSELQALVFTPNAGQPNTSSTTTFRLSDASTGYTPKVLTSFDGTLSKQPAGGLIEDAAGNLFGTTQFGGDGRGDVFVLPKIGDGYASTPIDLFNLGNGQSDPTSTLTMDSAGNLFTATAGGAAGYGSVIELVRSGGSFTGTTIATFNGTNGNGPQGKLIGDASGNLFGVTAAGGNSNKGTLFEIAKSGSTYSGPIVLASFSGINGNEPSAGGLVMDAAGDLFGTTTSGGANGDGTIFELAKSSGAITTLYSFAGTNGLGAFDSGLIMDAAGDLFGMTAQAVNGGGTAVVELAKTASGYSTTLTTLAYLTDGAGPRGNLVMDSAGNLFGATGGGGANGDGTVFEIVKTASGYSNTAITLTSFDLANGAIPTGDLIIDPDGNLIGMTEVGGTNEAGVIFEIPARPPQAITTTDITTTVTNTDPPAPPVVTITSVAEASVTAVQTITGMATSADATVTGRTVTLTDNGTVVGTAIVQSDGSFSASVTLSDFGANSIVASVTDSLGVTGTSAPVVDTLEHPAPPTVQITSAAEAGRTVVQTITGTVTSVDAVVAGQTVTVTDNGTLVGTGTVQANGSFSVDVTLTSQGTNSIVASVTDSLGVTGSSAAVVDLLDTIPPTVTITSAAEGSRNPGQTITGTVVSGGTAAVAGQTVTLTDNGITIGTATVQANGSFSANVTLPNQGTNSIVATVTDSYGNTGSSAAVVDTLDNIPPTVTITSAAEASNIAAQTITGTVVSGGAAAVVGQTVTVTDNGVTLGTAMVQSDGTFSLNATLPNQGANSIVATVADSYGNTGSSAGVVDLLDTIPPTVTITSAAEGSRNPGQTITGTVVSGGTAAVVGQTVTLTDNGVLLGTATVQSDGSSATRCRPCIRLPPACPIQRAR